MKFPCGFARECAYIKRYIKIKFFFFFRPQNFKVDLKKNFFKKNIGKKNETGGKVRAMDPLPPLQKLDLISSKQNFFRFLKIFFFKKTRDFGPQFQPKIQC
jgi:hypothetical protein